MLRRVRLEVALSQGSWPNGDPGSILHGILLEQLAALAPDYAAQLHDRADSLRPFTQAGYWSSRDTLKWQITAFQEEFSYHLDHWLQQLPVTITIRQVGQEAVMRLIATDENCLTYQTLVQTYFAQQPPPRRLQLRFRTPTAFRSGTDQRYVLFPEPRLLWQSALRKWETFCPDYRLGDPTLAEDLAHISYVSRYGLETIPVNLSGARLAGFVNCCHTRDLPDAGERQACIGAHDWMNRLGGNMEADFKEAQELGHDLIVKYGVTTNQIRKLLSAVNRLSNRLQATDEPTGDGKLSEEMRAEIQLMRVRLVYQVGKTDKKVSRQGMEELYRKLERRIEKAGSSHAEFKKFAQYVEAMVAYHKYHEPSKKSDRN